MKIETPYIYIQPLEGAFVCPRRYHDGVSKREATMGFLTTFYKYWGGQRFAHKNSKMQFLENNYAVRFYKSYQNEKRFLKL